MAFRLTFVLSSSSSFPSVWPILGACAGVYLFYHGFQLLVRKRLIENTPSSKIRSAAMGLVELSGLATGPYTMNAPITGLPCCNNARFSDSARLVPSARLYSSDPRSSQCPSTTTLIAGLTFFLSPTRGHTSVTITLWRPVKNVMRVQLVGLQDT